MNIQEELKQWEALAIEDVSIAKSMQPGGIIYLLCCIDNVRKAISAENPYILPASDIRYRTYVVSVLEESKKQELPGWEKFFVRVLMGK